MYTSPIHKSKYSICSTPELSRFLASEHRHSEDNPLERGQPFCPFLTAVVMIAIPCIAGPILIIFLLSINTSWAFIYPLNQTCSPPVSQGGSGYCGPKFCDVSASPAAACIFTNAVINYQERISSVKSKSCVQSTDGRCTSAALAALMKGPGIKAAYCNDEFLVIISDGTPGFKTNLDSVKNPPGAVDKNGMTCVTRYTNPAFMTVKIPLNPTLLATSTAGVNNVNTNSFPNGGGDGDGAYMSLSTPGTAATYGLPTRGHSLNEFLSQN